MIAQQLVSLEEDSEPQIILLFWMTVYSLMKPWAGDPVHPCLDSGLMEIDVIDGYCFKLLTCGNLGCSNRKLIPHDFNYHQMTHKFISSKTFSCISHCIFYIFSSCLKCAQYQTPIHYSQAKFSVQHLSSIQLGSKKPGSGFWYLFQLYLIYAIHQKFQFISVFCGKYFSLVHSTSTSSPLNMSSLCFQG